MEEKTTAACECAERHDRSDRRNTMLIISTVLQWMLMLVCIVYLAMLYQHQSHLEHVEKEYVRAECPPSANASMNGTKIMLMKKSGTMTVQNSSIFINKTGFYWIYFQGSVNYNEIGEIMFHCKHPGTGINTWIEQVKNSNIKAILLRNLFVGSEVYMTTTSNLRFEDYYLIVHPA